MSELALRPGIEGDADSIASVQLSARRQAAMPPPVHTDAEVRDFLAGRLIRDEVWVAELDGTVLGYARLSGDWLDDLYVAPAYAGQGVGSALLELAKALRPSGLCLWVFESNQPARDFYARRGFVALERTDGAANEEQAPDIRLAWPGAADPLAFFRGLIDEVDEQLGDLLARRVALTRAVQGHKQAGALEGSRDRARERHIAEQMALRAPELGAERLARIVETIISESLAAATDPGCR